MRDTAVEFDHQGEHVVQDIPVGCARALDDPVLSAALWQSMWPFDVPEVSVLQRGMDTCKVGAENGVHVEPPAMPGALVECSLQLLLCRKPAAQGAGDPVDRVDHVFAVVRQIEDCFLEPGAWWQAHRMPSSLGV